MKFVITLLLAILGVNSVYAQSFIIESRVCDKNDNEDVVGATVRVLSLPDSAFVSASSAYSRRLRNGEEYITSDFRIVLPSRQSDYLIEVSATGYNKEFVKVSPSTYGRRMRKTELPIIMLKHKTQELNQVTVTSSRIKFFHQGDTVVFNADGFRLAEGSMLDALVSQLPGVELKSDGRILYNGKYVESLLLDGKHFFNGNNRLMLENIGAYTVKNIKIYDKSGDASDFAGREIGNDKQLVMDVKLKKEYSSGLILNAEAGGGTNDRYLGRLFGMWFNSDTRLTVYGNSNNLNDDRKPGRSDSWKPEDLKVGVRGSNTGGFDYSADKKAAGWKASGNIQISHESLDNQTGIYRTNFFEEGDTYDRVSGNNHSKTFKVSTNHELYVKRKMFDITITPRFEYNNLYNDATTASVTFSSVNSQPGFMSDFVNRYNSEILERSKTLSTGISVNSRIKIKGCSDIMRIGVFGDYNNIRADKFNRYSIEYAENPEIDQLFDRYFKNHPNHNSRLGVTAGYNRRLAEGISMELTYKFTLADRDDNSTLYNLHELAADEGLTIGQLPSMAEYTATVDYSNSFEARYRNNYHTVSPLIIFDRGQWSGQINIPVTVSDRTLDYCRGDIDAHIRRNTGLVNVENTFVQWVAPDRTKKVEFNYNMTSEAPDLINFVDMTDDVDPLNIYLGNTSLKNSHLHNLRLGIELISPATKLMQFITLRYSRLDNALSKGFIYDSATGARHYRTYNVDGNWDANASYGVGTQFGKTKQFMLQSLTTTSIVNSVDLVGEDAAEPSRSTVITKSINEILKISYSLGKHNIGFNADVTYRNYSDVVRMNTWTQQYGVNAIVSLTSALQLSTDFNVYMRSGYNNSALNTTDLVWNARLSYSLMQGQLQLMLDGFDMLHNLSNVTYSVNAQARTETYISVLPRYFMFHVQYRFNRQPKKKKGK
ncbi:MAG: hypothetical protein HDS96_00580 [Bacteroidales bacterium]|nr:hypothetical protein [Bacteroidales bacterium]